MLHSHVIVPANQWAGRMPRDRVTLDYDARHRRRFVHKTEGGLSFLLDLPQAAVLHEGDGLLLSDGSMIAVKAAGEALMEVRAASPHALLRLAWHIGNRHLPAEIGDGYIRLRNDHVIFAMLEGLGASVTHITAPFTPESGAYAGGGGHHHG